MLSTGAFNALLKTLEEPPPHVKFFFATTEANKIPITVLSRCQRYDFAGITPDAIVSSLKEICTREQVEAETEALQVVARRAGGSMRDAQSLLEQLLASGSPKLTVEVVHALLGTPSDERLLGVLEALADHDSGAALALLDQAAAEGVQPADLLAGVLEFLRDALVLSVGAGSILLAITPRQKPRLQAVVDRWSTDAILAALQILAEARSRMRGVAHGRLLVELALVRVARLENLTELSNLVERLSAIESGTPVLRKAAAQSIKKKLSPSDPPAVPRPSSWCRTVRDVGTTPTIGTPVNPSIRSPRSQPGRGRWLRLPRRRAQAGVPRTRELRRSAAQAGIRPRTTAAASGRGRQRPKPAGSEPPSPGAGAVRKVWPELVKKVGVALGMKLVSTEAIGVEGADVLVIAAKPGYNSLADACGSDEARAKVEQSLERLLHRPVAVRYRAVDRSGAASPRPSQAEPRRPELLAADSMVQRVVELFEARPIHLEYEDDPDPM